MADAFEVALYIHSVTVGTEIIHGKGLNYYGKLPRQNELIFYSYKNKDKAASLSNRDNRNYIVFCSFGSHRPCPQQRERVALGDSAAAHGLPHRRGCAVRACRLHTPA